MESKTRSSASTSSSKQWDSSTELWESTGTGTGRHLHSSGRLLGRTSIDRVRGGIVLNFVGVQYTSIPGLGDQNSSIEIHYAWNIVPIIHNYSINCRTCVLSELQL